MLSVGWTDWWLTCQFLEGNDPRAAMGLMSYVMWLLPNLFASAAIGGTALVARYTGAGQPETAQKALHQALLAGGVFALFVFVVTHLTAASFGGWMQLSPPAAAFAGEYISIVAWVIPLIMIEQVGAACLRGAGDTITGFVAKAIVVVVNVVVSATLIQGRGPFPNLGWSALAIGTATGHGLGGALIGLRLLTGGSGLKITRRLFRPDRILLGKLIRIGAPGGLDMVALLVCQFIFVGIINRLGSDAAAAHGLAVQIEALGYLPGSAFQVAAATVAGQFLGALRHEKATRGVLLCLAMGGSIMLVAGGVFFFAGDYVTAFFTGSSTDPTAKSAAVLLSIVAFSMPSLAVTMILTGGFRGAGETRWPLAITLVGFLLVRIPLAFILSFDQLQLAGLPIIPGANLGVVGAWLAMLADLIVRSLLVGWRFWIGTWKQIEL